MFFHKNNYFKGWLSYNDTEGEEGWEFQICKRNGDIRWKIKVPNLLSQHSMMIDTKMVLPGWSNSVRQIIATARHVSAQHLNILSAPATLSKALADSYPDRSIRLASYLEEIQGLLRMSTFTVISEAEYKKLVKEHGIFAIPTMCVLTIKFDGHGDPVRAKSRTVALGNLETTDYTKGDCYAPVASHYAVRLVLCLAILSNRLLKQGDCKNAFVQSELDDLIVVRPPAGCPYSAPNTYWPLNKSLYGLRRAPRYWWDKSFATLKELNMFACPNEPCYFVGQPLANHPPLHLVLYVDDFIYFSTSDAVEAYFENLLKRNVWLILWALSKIFLVYVLIGT